MLFFYKKFNFKIFFFLITALILYFKKLLIFSCNSYLNHLSYTFENPMSSTMFGMMKLHDYIMFFLLIIFLYTIIFLYFALKTSFYGSNKEFFRNLTMKEQLVLKNFLISNITKNIYSKLTHNSLLEFIWTIIPGVILAFIAYPSFILLYTIDACLDPLYTITIIGNQWYWTYEYSDFDVETYFYRSVKISEKHQYLDLMINYFLKENFLFDYNAETLAKYIWNNYDIEKKIFYSCNMLPENMLPLGYLRLLSTDQVLVLPSKTPVKLLITANDVIHSWAVPSYGIKMDAIPGRLNQVYFYTEFFGSAWGQCSELCGVNHGFMPIEIRILPLPDFLFFIYLKLNSLIREIFFDLLKLKTKIYIYILNDYLEAFTIADNLNNLLEFKSVIWNYFIYKDFYYWNSKII